jgi:glycosyltransferase involved in cell wall biosynthesis
MHKIAIVVPTKDRPDDLRKLLASVSTQTRKPDQLIIVDGSDPDVRHVVESFPQLHLNYVRVFPPSLSQQRNAGMRQLRPEITLAGYLDDDIVLEPTAIESMVRFWESAPPDLGGAAFNITNVTRPRWQGVKQLFGIDSKVPGKVLASGFPSTLGSQLNDIYTDWLNGGATVWRREVIEKFGYDEWFLGTGFLEDVDFSFSVRQAYRLALVASARLAHYSRPVRLENERLLGKWQVVNRMYLVRKHRARGLSMPAAWIASITLLGLNMANALLRADQRYFLRARGNLAGIAAELGGRRERLGGHLK